ncbi:unnamed protein product [Parascedosporium putredinis]|uniref:FAD-binding domain-containing protein n=1 Tax=Parascedosporium putredinis TaxID=1442378 RepID=A0A9P1MA67_9PEZI|nr:unnamed protein product [Parascedosporium putredinis]CAI7993480.1 unnamed protein product [Parascedosporium putredinis]
MSSTSAQPLKVLVVGAGIGGLTAAIGLRQQGHEVTLFERTELAQETGAALHLAPNCHGLLRRFGIFPESFGANPVHGMAEYNRDGSTRLNLDLRQALSIWEFPWVLSHRVGLHNALKQAATGKEGKGTPAVLKTSSQVVDVDVETATITLADGTKVTGDVVLGADGVSSATRKAIVGESHKPFGSGKSAFRFLIPHETLLSNPNTKKFTETQGYMSMWYGDDRRLVMYPCNDNTIMNFVAIHPTDLSASKETVRWSRVGNKDNLLDIYKDFGTDVESLLKMTDADELKLWTLLDMERIPSWTKGRLALLGDAAHPFLPHQGQGGGVAIEDATSLVALLPLGTTPEDIPERLALYEKIRDERAHKIQEFTRIAGADLNDATRKSFNIMEFTKYNYGFSEWHNSTRALKEHLWAKNGKTYLRHPLSFGPMTSPRQDHYGRRIPSDRSRYTTHSLRFKTSATYLQTLFPTKAFSFASPGTVAEATFQCTQLDKMGWLGGGGYNYFGLWIHGVQYEKKDGTKVVGSFLPVLLENLSDPITTGREEIGMPKLYCEINVASDESSSRVSCAWRGATFMTMKLTGLAESAKVETNGEAPVPAAPAPAAAAAGPPNGPPAGPPQARRGRSASVQVRPCRGSKGVADAEYAVLIPSATATTARVADRTVRSKTGTIEANPGDWEALPTLHHVAEGLAEVPIYEVIEAKIEEGHGVEDVSQAVRIE